MEATHREFWKAVDMYLNYEVSNCGRVRNATTGKILKPYLNNNGYYYVSLSKDKKVKKFYIHRLVAAEFIDNLDKKPNVDHIDHDKTNNCINNLRWVSQSQNGMNRKKQVPPSSSNYKGVFFHKQNNKWRAHLKRDGVRQYLGSYDNEIDAARAYNKAALGIFGEYALLNEID